MIYIFAFPYFSTELRPLIYVQNMFLPNIVQINGYISRKFCLDIGIAEEWDCKWANFVQKQQSYEQVKPLMYLKMCFLPKSSEWIFHTRKAKAVFFFSVFVK